jgi:hypothetical protein
VIFIGFLYHIEDKIIHQKPDDMNCFVIHLMLKYQKPCESWRWILNRVLAITVVSILLLFFTSCSKENNQIGIDAPPDAVPDILGTYVLNGTDHLGNDYGGHLTISAGENPNEFQFQWIIIESIQVGSGVLEGNKLKVEWRSLDETSEPYQGKVTYTVTINGELYGIRTLDGRDGQGNEIAYPNQ